MNDAPALAAVTARARAAGERAFGPGWRPDRRAIAPGRVELIGNHIDYNGCPVLCAAIDRALVVLAGPGDAGIRAAAADSPVEGIIAVDPAEARDWRGDGSRPVTASYLRGAVAGVLARPSLALREPVTLAIAGDVPLGFGLSSSAALCVGLALALAEPRLPDPELVLLAQEAEHRAGAPCGTMDQSASVAGGVILYDGATLGIEQLQPDLGGHVFAVIDSGVERSLALSSYPARVEESRRALALANLTLGLSMNHLAELPAASLARLTEGPGALPSPLDARARHVVAETARVRLGVAALRAGDWPAFGRLMTESGRSSASDYAISHPRVEEMVAEALAVDGVLGARMMGGGEGGAAIALLPADRVSALEHALRRGYFARHGMAHREGLVQPCSFAPGARIERL
ncbi:MAG: galactokinase [Chloroflexota bacterium]